MVDVTLGDFDFEVVSVDGYSAAAGTERRALHTHSGDMGARVGETAPSDRCASPGRDGGAARRTTTASATATAGAAVAATTRRLGTRRHGKL